jgi:SAM-dependent methyltransferase
MPATPSDACRAATPRSSPCGWSVRARLSRPTRYDRAVTETPARRPSIWDSPENAALYADYTREFPMYAETSRDLVRLAALAPDAAVIDLACGTGVTTRQILAALGPDGRVTGVDKSAAMLAIAARSVPDDRVGWVQALAEEFDQQVSGPVGAVICNSAIWQTQLARTAAAVRAVLGADGVFAFNIGVEFVRGAGRNRRDAERDGEPSLLDIMRDIAAADYGWSPPSASPVAPRGYLSQDEIEQVLRDSGFPAVRAEWIDYEQPSGSLRAWLTVPAFTDRQLPGMPYETRMAVLDKAYEQLGPVDSGASRWLAVAARF